MRDENIFISPYAIQTAFHTLSLLNNTKLNDNLHKKVPFYFYNYFILGKDLVQPLRENLNVGEKNAIFVKLHQY